MKRRKKLHQGASLASVLVISVLMLMVAMTMLGLGFHNLRLTDRYENQIKARALADATLAEAISILRRNPSFQEVSTAGTSSDIPDGSSILFDPRQMETRREGDEGRLSFDPRQAREWGIPVSINNLPNDSALEDDAMPGLQVPPSSAYLVSEGTYNGTTVRVETIVTIPGFPFTMGSNGPMALDSVVIGSAREGDATKVGDSGFDKKRLLPANLVSNASSGAPGSPGSSVILSGKSYVSGDVVARGKIELPVGEGGEVSQVGGDLKQITADVDLPKINIRDYDTIDKPNLRKVVSSNELNIIGYARSVNDLTVSGPLKLDGGVLYVDGSLEVFGGIQGKGAVIVNGDTKITGKGSLTSDGTVALLSQGDLYLKGSGQGANGTKLEGMVYTEGDFHAENLSLSGVFVANKEKDTYSGSGAGLGMNLQEGFLVKGATVLEKHEYTDVAFEVKNPVHDPNLAGGSGDSSSGGGSGELASVGEGSVEDWDGVPEDKKDVKKKYTGALESAGGVNDDKVELAFGKDKLVADLKNLTASQTSTFNFGLKLVGGAGVNSTIHVEASKDGGKWKFKKISGTPGVTPSKILEHRLEYYLEFEQKNGGTDYSNRFFPVDISSLDNFKASQFEIIKTVNPEGQEHYADINNKDVNEFYDKILANPDVLSKVFIDSMDLDESGSSFWDSSSTDPHPPETDASGTPYHPDQPVIRNVKVLKSESYGLSDELVNAGSSGGSLTLTSRARAMEVTYYHHYFLPWGLGKKK